MPDAACVDDSFARSSRSAKTGLQVVQPSREPGQMVLEKVSMRTTRPWQSRWRYDGTRLARNSASDSVLFGKAAERSCSERWYSPDCRK